MANIDEIYKMLETHSVVLASDSRRGIHIVYYPWEKVVFVNYEQNKHRSIYDDTDIKAAVNEFNSYIDLNKNDEKVIFSDEFERKIVD